jgi:hypothetical protein
VLRRRLVDGLYTMRLQGSHVTVTNPILYCAGRKNIQTLHVFQREAQLVVNACAARGVSSFFFGTAYSRFTSYVVPSAPSPEYKGDTDDAGWDA